VSAPLSSGRELGGAQWSILIAGVAKCNLGAGGYQPRRSVSRHFVSFIEE
jgi:hypothetical protein